MPSQVTTVGPLTLPVPETGPRTRITDPTVDALLDYLAFWIKNSLDAKLPELSGTGVDAVPVANRFPFDPTEDRGFMIKLPVPALFVWWMGTSRIVQRTMVFDYRVRTLRAMYVFEELPSLESMRLRTGLLADVDAAFAKAGERLGHPEYGYAPAAAGTLLPEAIASFDRFSLSYMGGTPGRTEYYAPSASGGVRRKVEQAGAFQFPALRGDFEVWERIDQDSLVDPDDALGDTLLTINASDGESANVTEIMQRWLPSPDGSEE